jgi:hypothetical protein
VDYRAELLSQVERVLAGALSVPAFEARFYDFYMDEVPEAALSQPEHDFVSEICERLDYTVEPPDAESRGYGYGDRAEFLAWLRDHLAAFRSAGGLPPAV